MPLEPLVVQSDRRALSQILINLLNNAIKFTDEGGIKLHLLYAEDGGPYDVTGTRVFLPSPSILFEISDTGIGISEIDQSRLFQVFERVGLTSSRHREGTGLGLRLSKMLADLLHGTITVQSVLGQGSTFTLVLPVE